MTTYLDGDRFRARLEEMQESLVQSARERHEADGENDPTALRMDGGVANLHLLLTQLHHFEVDPAKPRKTAIKDIHTETKELVRRQAPGTSWAAALSITPEGRQRMYKAIYLVLSRLGPKTDHEIREELERRNFDHSWSGLSARRVELERAGWVRDSGEKRQTQFGKLATVWEAVPEDG